MSDSPLSAADREFISPIEDIIEEASRGRMFILVDDEDRENEGDLVIPAEKADADAVNFMAKYGRGLICLAMTRERIEQLGLPLMEQSNVSRHSTAFTVSIEAREGVTTGISAADRARSVAVAVDPTKGRGDLTTPGHVFPLMARDGGTLVRAGHTEAAVDLARIGGWAPAGVICEIMNDDGSMARLPDLVRFAQYHGLRIGTIADLIAYRRRHERMVERKLETELQSRFGGDWHMVIYVNTVSYAEHIALVKGDIAGNADPVPVRMHQLNVLDDVLGDEGGSGAGDLHRAMTAIGREGRGVVVLIREPRPDSLTERLKARLDGQTGTDTRRELRDYGVGAQILLDLGVRTMALLSNSQRNVIGLEGYGLEIVERRPIPRPS
ncbi:3,4-dihydroxy-2-butanone-4-phosphate synthase [Fodinicurvata sp. EGI_FJ10296]|uniref:3,4-dihydroxy-2-butanone-4-phosphate synthase n=1 Tax=Fodinicurvata sp. EGI_FJ10296 TaxID=3231908 RepID=UPI0034528680